MIKSTSCSSKGSGFDSHTHMVTPEDLRRTQADKTSVHIKQNKILKKKERKLAEYEQKESKAEFLRDSCFGGGGGS